MCHDYRASVSIDLKHDRATREAGIKIHCPMLALEGATGKIAKWYDALAIWRERCSNEVSSGPIQSGHYIAEETPAELLERSNRFF